MTQLKALRRLQAKLTKLDAERDLINAQINELLNDPLLKQEQEYHNRRSAMPPYAFAPAIFLDQDSELVCYEAGLRNLSDFVAWLHNPTPSIPTMDKRRINRAIKDLRRQIQWDKAEEYGRAILRGEHQLRIGMNVHFIEVVPSETQKILGYAYGRVADVDQNARTIKVTINRGYPSERSVELAFEDITEAHPAESTEILFPLDQCDEREMLSWTIPDYMLREQAKVNHAS